MTCTCIDICECLGGCCKYLCGEHVCDHEKHECNCGNICGFCKLENKMACTCIDICECLGGCCEYLCGEPVCNHDKYECTCGILCDFCKMEENLIDIKSSMKRKLYDDDAYDTDGAYDADDGDSDFEESNYMKNPVKKLRFNKYNL